MHKTAAFATLGCKVNQYETQAMRELLEKAGFIILPFEEAADLYIINSCTVTNVADRKSRQHIGQARKKNPDAPVIMSGCLAQRDAEHILAIEGVAAVLGNAGRKQIAEIAERVLNGERNIAVVGDILHNHKFDDIKISKNDERLRANLKICDGCQNFCSYCIIPYTRGPVRSRPLEDIRAEALELVKTGIKEIVLTGIEVASYGRDMENRFGLLDAIKAARVPGIERIRLSSLEASILTEDFCRQAAEIPELCRHFHVSLQSGSDGVLKRMHRKYTTEEFAGYIANLRKYFDDPGITTDIIAGFPGETEEEHSETLSFVRKIGFSKIHVFPYSRREGTVAAKMSGQVLNEVKKRRAAEIAKTEEPIAAAYLERFIGCEDLVLIEQELSDGRMIGHTDRYLQVICEGEPNEIVRVRLEKREGDKLIGKTIR